MCNIFHCGTRKCCRLEINSSFTANDFFIFSNVTELMGGQNQKEDVVVSSFHADTKYFWVQ
jgi:hypothetical protein